ncbi:FkbM family methyltransferase [Celeribacter sp.]|uniref:FkbM family methyltransferase n=1 Tax=Celeribacter sp. TaxID=1890673 RepID=UPI003A8EA858
MKNPISKHDFHEMAKQRGYVRKSTPSKVFGNMKRTPDVIVDIGVRGGTDWLYNAFPDTPFVLVDPQRADQWNLDHKPGSYVIVNKGLSDTAGRMDLMEQGGKSTFHDRTALTSEEIREVYSVEVVTFDQMADDLALTGKIGLKIDVEGHELRVLRGIKAYRKSIDFIVVEMSILNRFVNTPTFSDIVVALNEMGFRFYNLMNHARPKAPLHYDGIFLQHDDVAFDAPERHPTADSE